MAIHSRNKTLTLIVLPFTVLICFATVYTRAHYAIDSMMGLVAGLAFYLLWMWVSKKYKI
jgi:membrane-associated phospholipid phosphatase